jgi:thiamine pyrophosphokinase
VDGGGNQWSEMQVTNPSLKFPHVISGDFDSICPKVLSVFSANEGTEIVHTPNQDETDFTKSLRVFGAKNTDNSMQVN